MNKDEVARKILAILERSEPLPRDTLKEKLTYRYLDEGHIDSFAIMNIIVEFEDVFDITLSSEDTQSDEFRTAAGLVTIVTERITT